MTNKKSIVGGLVLFLRRGDVILLGDDIVIEIVQTATSSMRLAVRAPIDLKIKRDKAENFKRTKK